MDQGHSRLYPFDPGSGDLPEIAAPGALLSGAGGGVVTLIVAPDVIQSSWSPAAAVAVARAWSDQGHRVVLFDLSLTNPVLHDALGLPNAVGIVDLVLRGASIPAVAQQAGSAGFQFVAVGTPVDDPTEVTLTEGWSTFVDEVGHAQATVLFYVPADLPGVDALVARSSATLLLAGDPTEAEWVAQSFALDEVSGLVAERGEAPSPAAEPPDTSEADSNELAFLAATPGGDGEREAEATVVHEPVEKFEPEARREAQREAQPEAQPEPDTRVAPEPLEEPEPRVIPWRPAAVGTMVGVGALVLWKMMFAPDDALSPPVPVETPQTTTTSEASSEPSEPDPQQAYSLTLAAYGSGDAAGRQAQGLAQRRPDLLFIVAPVRVADRVYHRVLVGPAADSLGAERLRASLAETLGGDGASWIVRPTPLAFDFGEFDSTQAAAERVAEIGSAGIGAYYFEVSRSAAPMFRVYAGAYESPAEAEVMRGALDAALGDVPTLGPRIGRYAR